jgi:hypothetical protein
MIRERGYPGSVVQLRRTVATLRPARAEPFLRWHAFPAEEAQVDWAHFGEVAVGPLVMNRKPCDDPFSEGLASSVP